MKRKDISLSVWRSSLTEDDWNFLQVQNGEWPQCLVHELHREKIQAEAGGSFPSSIQYKPTSQEQRMFRLGRKLDEDIREMLGRLGHKPAGKLYKQDWPSYLTWRKAENWKRIPKEQRETWHWISLDWHTLYRHWGDEVEYAGKHLPFPPVTDGNGETEIVPFRIPWFWRDEEIKTAFAQWLKEFRRIPEPIPPAKITGAASFVRQAQKNLKALAAWRLIQHHKGNRHKAYQHPGAVKYLGKTYANASEWSDAKKTVKAALNQFQQLVWEAQKFAFTQSE